MSNYQQQASVLIKRKRGVWVRGRCIYLDRYKTSSPDESPHWRRGPKGEVTSLRAAIQVV